MKPLKMINLFESIPKINSYSHYGSSLEKLFKMSSLKYFIKTLKFKEEFHKKFLKEESVNKKKKEYDIYEMEGITNTKDTNDEDIFSLSDTKSVIKPKIKNKEINKSYFYHKKNFSTINDSPPDALKYYPNFNSISKNIPSVRIVKPSSDKNKFLRKNILLNSEKKIDINKLISKDSTTPNKNLLTISNERRKNNLLINEEGNMKRFITEVPIKNKSKNFFKNNSVKKYPYKLPNIITSAEIPHYMLELKHNKKRNIENDLNNNTISFYNKNRAIDFSKMQKRSSKIFLNLHSLKVPNSGYYEPKYNLIEKRQYNIHINKKPILDNFTKKQILLKKIMTSYYINPNYQLIDGTKLNDEAVKKLNL